MSWDLLTGIAYAGVAVLIALLGVCLAFKLLGKIAKFIVTLIVIALVLWFLLSDRSILQTVTDFVSGGKFESIKEWIVSIW